MMSVFLCLRYALLSSIKISRSGEGAKHKDIVAMPNSRNHDVAGGMSSRIGIGSSCSLGMRSVLLYTFCRRLIRAKSGNPSE